MTNQNHIQLHIRHQSPSTNNPKTSLKNYALIKIKKELNQPMSDETLCRNHARFLSN
jgi:hypothetical protein